MVPEAGTILLFYQIFFGVGYVPGRPTDITPKQQSFPDVRRMKNRNKNKKRTGKCCVGAHRT